MRVVRCFAVVFLSLSLISGCTDEKPTNNTDQSNADFKIAYLSNKESAKRYFDIFVNDTSGQNAVNLTKGRNDVRSFASPKFSKDQQFIFYTADVEKQMYLNYIDLNADTIYTITKLSVQNSNPIYSSNTNKVFFKDKLGNGNGIYSIDLNGENRKALTEANFDVAEFDLHEQSMQIVFSARYRESSSIFLYNIEEDFLQQLTDMQGDDKYPSFSTDGNQILFASSRKAEDKGDFDIYLVDSNGENLRVIYNSKYFDSKPEFSPDSKLVAFISNRRGMKYRDILIKEIDGEDGKNLTMDLGILHQNFSFSPDGKFIGFEHVQSINSDIYLVEIETGKFKNISDDTAWDTAPAL